MLTISPEVLKPSSFSLILLAKPYLFNVYTLSFFDEIKELIAPPKECPDIIAFSVLYFFLASFNVLSACLYLLVVFIPPKPAIISVVQSLKFLVPFTL